MLKITEYALAEGIDNMRIALAQGWQPYGNPSFNPGMFKVIQAVVKYEKTSTDTEVLEEVCNSFQTLIDGYKKLFGHTCQMISTPTKDKHILTLEAEERTIKACLTFAIEEYEKLRNKLNLPLTPNCNTNQGEPSNE